MPKTEQIINIEENLKNLSSKFSKSDSLFVILAAGHGKRIKSSTSKLLHKIWGIPAIERVHQAIKEGMPKTNVAIVVGIKANEVAASVGKKDNTVFVYQKEQLGTGHAVQVALNSVDLKSIKYCYVIYADMALMDSSTISEFHETFIKSKADMIAMTANYEGDSQGNYYGRILRVRTLTTDGKVSKYKNKTKSEVLGVLEHKDIMAMKEGEKLFKSYLDEKFNFDKDELLELKEYNAGVYGFKMEPMIKLIGNLKTNNAQGELYLTDMLEFFLQDKLKIATFTPKNQNVVLGFNDKSVLKEMDSIARLDIYNKLKNIITIVDADDFYIEESVAKDILKRDSDEKPLDIYIGKGAYIGKNVVLNYRATIEDNARLEGNIHLGENTYIGSGVLLSCNKDQSLEIKNNVTIYSGNQIRGNVIIGENTVLERGVNITGSNDHPSKIGKNVLIKGVSYLYGCIVDDNILIEHCIFYYSHTVAKYDKNKKLIPLRFIRPTPEGTECVSELDIKKNNLKTKK